MTNGTCRCFNYFKEQEDKWIINEANLVFYVDQDACEENEPDRLILYDLKNNTPIIDYFLDGLQILLNLQTLK